MQDVKLLKLFLQSTLKQEKNKRSSSPTIEYETVRPSHRSKLIRLQIPEKEGKGFGTPSRGRRGRGRGRSS